LRAAGGRPNVLVRYPNGIGGEFFYQKRAPESRPPWIEAVSLRFPSGRSADEVVPRDAAALLWMANLACLELHPHPVRAEDLDHPDELRVDLDPVPGIEWSQIRAVAGVVRATLHDLGLVGWPKTSGSRGMHIYVRIFRDWTFADVRRAALAFAREVERRAPALATSKWWKEERHGVFLDYNQNAKDRTIAAAYSVRPTPDARVSAPLTWDEIGECDPRDFTMATMPTRFSTIGDRHAEMDAHPCSLASLLDLAARDEREGLGDAPWPPHYRKQAGEPARVQPSRRRTPKFPLIEIGRAKKKADALAGVERWRARHPEAASHLEPADVLVDAMRGRFHTWTRVRINLQHIPEELRPPQEALDPDDDPWSPENPRGR
jgi:DNA ligase D-like protein (predicted polymerase)